MILLAQAFPDVFGSALQPVCAALLACIAIALPFVWMGERGVRPLAAFRDLLLHTYAVCDPAVDGFFDAWTNAVADACFTGVRPGPASDFLRVAWPDPAAWPAAAASAFEFFACRDPASDQSFP